MAPSNYVNGINVCKFASKGCRNACLFTAGRGRMSNVIKGRVRKTILFRDNKNDFMSQLISDIKRLEKKAKKKGMRFAVRLNGTSDICYEKLIHGPTGKNIFEIMPHVTFYDYTKDFTRKKALSGHWKNYHLTFSMSESKRNQREAFKLFNNGVNVAVVFDIKPQVWHGKTVIDADMHDLRFLDGKGVICGLTAKGDAKKDESGFVQRIENEHEI